MINTQEIRLVPELTGQTSSTEQSALALRKGYLVYTSSFGGGLVDEFTVRSFLDNPNNEQIATDFFNYLQQNFTKPQFNDLYYNNQKLANILNDYYETTIVSNLKPTTDVANTELAFTTATTYTNTNFINYNTRSNEKIAVSIQYNTGDSYYIGFSISKTFTLLDNQNYDKYRKDSLGPMVTKEVAEEFRYAIRSNSKIPNENMVVHANSFSEYIERLPVGLNNPQIRIQFKNDKFIIPTNAKPSTIPIEIVFDNPAQFTGQTFQLNIESATGTDNSFPIVNTGGPIFKTSSIPISIGTDIGLSDGNSDNLKSQNILISYGQSGFTGILIIKNPKIFRMSSLTIELTLVASTNIDFDANKSSQAYSVSNSPFLIHTQEAAEIEVFQNESVDFVKKEQVTTPQRLIQSFVDFNFNDSESDFWLNPATTGFPAGFVVATPPIQPPPSAPKTGNTNVSLFAHADLTKNTLYNTLLKVGYKLTKREGVGGAIITMDGNNITVKNKLKVGPSFAFNQKIASFAVQGYNLIKYDVTDATETAKITSVLTNFFLPYKI